MFFFLMIRPPPRSTRTDTLFPYTTLFRSISTQCLMAAGAALSFKLRRQDRVAVACGGDGGSSKTDFYAAVNSGGAYKLPLILCVINNGWAISVPRSSQTGAQTLAQKGLAGGLHCLQVDRKSTRLNSSY